MHDYHEKLPGYSPNQIWHDGCAECEQRGADPVRHLGTLDDRNFFRAWKRACEWETKGLADISRAESGLLKLLWAVQLRLERLGIPLGNIPGPQIKLRP
jgi:hypothetical protein